MKKSIIALMMSALFFGDGFLNTAQLPRWHELLDLYKDASRVLLKQNSAVQEVYQEYNSAFCCSDNVTKYLKYLQAINSKGKKCFGYILDSTKISVDDFDVMIEKEAKVYAQELLQKYKTVDEAIGYLRSLLYRSRNSFLDNGICQLLMDRCDKEREKNFFSSLIDFYGDAVESSSLKNLLDKITIQKPFTTDDFTVELDVSALPKWNQLIGYTGEHEEIFERLSAAFKPDSDSEGLLYSYFLETFVNNDRKVYFYLSDKVESKRFNDKLGLIGISKKILDEENIETKFYLLMHEYFHIKDSYSNSILNVRDYKISLLGHISEFLCDLYAFESCYKVNKNDFYFIKQYFLKEISSAHCIETHPFIGDRLKLIYIMRNLICSCPGPRYSSNF